MSTSQQIVSKLWSYCNILRDDGLSYPDYVEQLTFLIFLKMASEQSNGGFNPKMIPAELDWSSLLTKRGNKLHSHYTHILESLADRGQMLGLIFGGARNRIKDPEKLHRLIVELIDREDWTAYDTDIKGEAYEGLLEKTAQDSKSGAGQYFTPRPLIRSIVEVLHPEPGQTICDPACGTCGFLLGAREYILRQFPDRTKKQERHQREAAYRGVELVDSVARLGAMNLYLHGIGGSHSSSHPPISVRDSLLAPFQDTYDIVITNPPFGRKSSMPSKSARAEGKPENTASRSDLWVTTGNKQLNFLQHIPKMLSPGGRAAVVVPDNVLFERGVGEVIRRRLIDEYDLHTLLRLPPGLFYAQGVKANVIFFDRPLRARSNAKKRLWVYDLRTDMHFTLKNKPLRSADLKDFVECFAGGPDSDRTETWTNRRNDGRWRSYSFAEMNRRPECNLDFIWLNSSNSLQAQPVPKPEIIAQSIAADLRTALNEIEELAARFSIPVKEKRVR